MATKKAHEKKLDVTNMRMLRWILCEDAKLDKIRNDRIREMANVGEIFRKVQETRSTGKEVQGKGDKMRADTEPSCMCGGVSSDDCTYSEMEKMTEKEMKV